MIDDVSCGLLLMDFDGCIVKERGYYGVGGVLEMSTDSCALNSY